MMVEIKCKLTSVKVQITQYLPNRFVISPTFSKPFLLKVIDYKVYSFPYLRVSATSNNSMPSFFEAIDHQNN